jgi:gas vesicle protein
MNEQIPLSRDYGFLAGVLTGAVVGAGVALWLAPSATAEVRGRLTSSARRLGEDLRGKGDVIRDRMAEAVVRGAQDVEQFAVAAKAADRRTL